MERASTLDSVGLEMFYPSSLTSSPVAPPKQEQQRRSSSCQPKGSIKEYTRGVPSPKPVLDADGKIIYRRERRAFTADEDVRLIKGFERHGPSWTKIQRDPELDFSTRRSTDLRDRFRNAFPAQYAAAGFKARPPKTSNKRSRTASQGSTSSLASPVQQPLAINAEQPVHWAPISYQSSSSNASSIDAPSVFSASDTSVKDRRSISQAARSMSLDSGFYSGASGSTSQLETWPEYYGSYLLPQQQSALAPPTQPLAPPQIPMLNNYLSPIFDTVTPLAPPAPPLQTYPATMIPDEDGMSQFWQAGAMTGQYATDDLSMRYGMMNLPGL